MTAFWRHPSTRIWVNPPCLFSQLSDDSSIFTTSQRDKIKKSVGSGKFLGFDRISVLDDDAIFVEYFVDESKSSDYLFNYNKQFSLVSGNFDVIKTAKSEAELDVEHIVPYLSPSAMPSNIVPDYEKASSFRGIDDHVTYFSSSESLTSQNAGIPPYSL